MLRVHEVTARGPETFAPCGLEEGVPEQVQELPWWMLICAACLAPRSCPRRVVWDRGLSAGPEAVGLLQGEPGGIGLREAGEGVRREGAALDGPLVAGLAPERAGQSDGGRVAGSRPPTAERRLIAICGQGWGQRRGQGCGQRWGQGSRGSALVASTSSPRGGPKPFARRPRSPVSRRAGRGLGGRAGALDDAQLLAVVLCEVPGQCAALIARVSDHDADARP